ncbi:hypothetical protein [Streptomyces sp. NBC_00658]|uniref:hypothetical protein n=1 Tax=Streptomyces sp. NBC_00658 TaxID=2975800 RepID=UPI00386C5323
MIGRPYCRTWRRTGSSLPPTESAALMLAAPSPFPYAVTVVYLAVGLLARTVLKTRPSAARAVTRASGAMMIVIGGFLLVERLVG